MTSIRDAVQGALSPAHMTYAEGAIRACEQREAEMVASLSERAVSEFGLPRDRVEAVLRESGFTTAAAPGFSTGSESDPGGGAQITLEGIAARLDRLDRRIETASRAAERVGVRF